MVVEILAVIALVIEHKAANRVENQIFEGELNLHV